MFFAAQLEQLESIVESILETAMQLGETVGLGRSWEGGGVQIFRDFDGILYVFTGI